MAPGRHGKLAVVSDIDDTIIETGAGNLRANWRRVFAEMPGEREVVPGSVEFYARLGGGHVGEQGPATRRPFFYVSSSPWNLFDYLVAFQKAHGALGFRTKTDYSEELFLNRAFLDDLCHDFPEIAAIELYDDEPAVELDKKGADA